MKTLLAGVRMIKRTFSEKENSKLFLFPICGLKISMTKTTKQIDKQKLRKIRTIEHIVIYSTPEA